MSPAQQLDEATIRLLVDRFYDRVQADELLGPVFDAAVDDWPEHKALLTAFWCSVALRAGTYRGNPLGMHRPHPIGREHFQRWLALWRETTAGLLAPTAAATMQAFADRIGTGMQLGLGLLDRSGRGGRPLGIPVVGTAPPER